ncbi:hypothetical protein [Sciscionella marina]|uniref:hypothetical protein n=1 Tax=Sciscionella marina TaxID=508770 RepID=UPI000380B8C3|nr:hypothetical protein [Sciscionella marina]
MTFTWNIKTPEGKPEIQAMLEERLDRVRPDDGVGGNAELSQDSDGVVEGLIRFGTAVARGHGYVRIRNGRIWTVEDRD